MLAAAVLPVAAITLTAKLASASTQAFNYTGSVQTWTVPAGVTSVGIDAQGAKGGREMGGLGGWAHGVFSVTPGQTLSIYVGGLGGDSGAAGYNGGGYQQVFSGGGGGAVRRTSASAVGR